MKKTLALLLITAALSAKPLVKIKAPAVSQAQINTYLKLINNIRSHSQDCGQFGIKPPAKPLKWNYNLYKAAYEHSRDMAMNSFLEHYGSNTKYD